MVVGFTIPITTKVVGSNRAHGEAYFSPGTPVFSYNKTDRFNITELLLKVALNTITRNIARLQVRYIESNTGGSTRYGNLRHKTRISHPLDKVVR